MNNTLNERHAERSTFSSRLRRSFSNDKCYCFDIDGIEVRYVRGVLEIVAICEYKHVNERPASKAQRELITRLAETNDAKALIIYYDEAERLSDSTLFVQEIHPEQKDRVEMNMENFRDFIRTLGQPKRVPEYVLQLQEIEREQELRKSSDQIV